jgi:hypothetical protein
MAIFHRKNDHPLELGDVPRLFSDNSCCVFSYTKS